MKKITIKMIVKVDVIVDGITKNGLPKVIDCEEIPKPTTKVLQQALNNFLFEKAVKKQLPGYNLLAVTNNWICLESGGGTK